MHTEGITLLRKPREAVPLEWGRRGFLGAKSLVFMESASGDFTQLESGPELMSHFLLQASIFEMGVTCLLYY